MTATATPVPATATTTPVPPTATAVPPTATGAPTATSGPTGPTTLTLVPAAAQDDARSPDGGGYTATELAPLVGSGNGVAPNVAGYRFTDVPLPPGALIESATFSLVKAGTAWARLVVELGFEDSGDAAPFSAGAPPAGRPRTATQALLDQNVQLLDGTRYPVGDPAALAQALQAVVARPDWQAGNSLVVLAYGPPSPAWARQ
ncbi:MAG: hypothetical protein HY332_15330, partial [Chloroflexi bacterium]|nr:hypothetical protein [Chloroflexota bacterium]